MASLLMNFQDLLPALAETAELFVPRSGHACDLEGGPDIPTARAGYRFVPWDGRMVDLSGYGNTAVSVKALFFPGSETLYRFEVSDRVCFDPEPAEKGKRIVFGARPCDCAALSRLDAVFGSDPVDGAYMTRRAFATIVGLACTEPAGPTCFCTSVGLSPDTTDSMDVRATHLGDGRMLLESITEKGERLLDRLQNGPARAASAEEQQKAESLRRTAAEALPTFDLNSQALAFDSPLWRAAVLGCLGCGICTFLCPSCHCFSIEHLGHARKGRAIRVWDSCQFQAYSLEASGFNPRPNPEDRLRQRLLHKFTYYPRKHNGTPMCVGCGRCVLYCPAGLDLRELFAVDSTQPLEETRDGNG